MNGKVTSKKLAKANEWLANINANEKELKFIVEKDISTVYLTFYLRSEKIYSKFKRMLKNKSTQLIEKGWSLGESKLSYSDRDIFIYAASSEGVSCVELQFKFSIGENISNDLNDRIELIKETLKLFKDNINELKMSMDIKYSLSKDINIPEDKCISIIESLSFERIFNIKGKYRKFEIMNNHNVTDQIMVHSLDKHVNVDISINVENIVVDDINLNKEILYSSYYYIIEYAKFHYNILNKLDSNYLSSKKDFYDKLKKEF